MTKKRKNLGRKKSKGISPPHAKESQKNELTAASDDKKPSEDKDSKYNISPFPLGDNENSEVKTNSGNNFDEEPVNERSRSCYTEEDDTSSENDLSGVWRRRTSVLNSVAEMEQLPLVCEEGEDRLLLGGRPLPGLATGNKPSPWETQTHTLTDTLLVDETHPEEEEEEEATENRSRVSVWRRRGSVKETVVEIEQQLLDGAVFPLPGTEHHVARKQKQKQSQSQSQQQSPLKSVSPTGDDVLVPSSRGEGESMLVARSDTASHLVTREEEEGSEDTSAHSLPPNVIEDRSKSACVLEQSRACGDWKPFDIMDARPVSAHILPAQGSMDEADTDIDSLFLKSLNKLVRVLYEFLETEIKFSTDVNSLKAVLSEIKYSTMSCARMFVSCVPYVGILVSTESIKITSNLLVNLFQESKIFPSLDINGSVVSYADVSECFDCCNENCKAVFNGLERCAPFFPLYASFIINHDGLSQSYRDFISSDEDFQQYMSSAEILVGEAFLSLLIKPVQRLPREIHSSIAKSISLLNENDPYFEQMQTLFMNSKKMLENMTSFTSTCNESVRMHQDNLRMHSLKLAFEDSGADGFGPDLIEGFVSNKRRIIREGQLLRHHKHRAASPHEFQVFSDLMLSSAAVGSSLRLEHVVMLGKACDTVCFAIPSMFHTAESSWFFISSQKIFFCKAASMDKRDLWVQDLSKCLIDNKADNDKYLMKKQIALVNAIISQINMLWRENQHANEVSLNKEGEGQRNHQRDSSSASMDPVWIQVSWWRLLDILKNLEAGATEGQGENVPSPSSSLQRVIDLHAQEVTNRILQSVGLADMVDGDDLIASTTTSSSPRASGPPTQSSLAALLLNHQPHYLIATGFFFEASSYGAGSSLDDGVRPLILRLLLLSDVLVATYFDTVDTPLRYAFHIHMKDMLCSDFRADEVGPTALQLIDLSVKVSSRRFSLFGKPSPAEQKKRERILFAPTIEMKFDWLALLMQTVASNKDVPPALDSLRINTIPLPLQRVGSVCSAASWEYEHNMVSSKSL